MTATLPHALTRTVRIGAAPDVVFGFFTDSERWARWWGVGSTIDPRPGGRILIRYPNAVEASGEVLTIEPPKRLEFTFGYASGVPIAPGSSRVSIVLERETSGTRLHLTHAFAEAGPCEAHVQGWRYQLAVFANAVADAANADAAGLVDAWFAAWRLDDDGERTRALQAIATSAVSFRDRFSAVEGVDDLVPHIGAARRFMSGVVLARSGAVRHCQGVLLADWTATSADGQPLGSGTNVFELDASGRIARVTGFWA